MHLIESTKTSATSGSCPEAESPGGEGQPKRQPPHLLLPGGNRKSSRPWDYDTEDSGVDSVSSLAGLEADSGHPATVSNQKTGSVEYSAVIVNNNNNNNNKVNATVVVADASKQPVQQRKSFLHTSVYGGVQRSSPPPDAGTKNLSRKNVTHKVISKKGHGVNQQHVSDGRALDSAKNHFLHSLLDDEVTKAVRTEQDLLESSASSTSAALDLLPELVQLLDANRVMDGGLIELIGRDGTRASLRVTLASQSTSSSSAAVMTSRKNSFNTRLHRNSKRSSQRRCHKPTAEVVAAATTTANNKTASAPANNNLSSDGSGSAGFITAQRPRSVRRRPSLSSSFHQKVVPGFSVSMAIPPSKVAILASKFNSLINESRRSSATTAAAANNNNTLQAGPDVDDKKLSTNRPVESSPNGIPATPISSSTWSWRLVGPTASESLVPKRNNNNNNLASSRFRPIDTIPEMFDPPPEQPPIQKAKSSHVDYGKPRRKSHDLSQPYGGRIHPVARPLPSDPAGSLKNRESVYGTVMSIVKQAIRKFEKLEDGKAIVGVESSSPDHPSAPPTPSANDGATSSCSYYQEPAAVIPEGIEPNNSFLWRDQKSLQNLIYEATSFSERTATSLTGRVMGHPEACNYYEMGGSSKYDTLRSRRSNAYDTLHHRNQSKSSSSSSSSGYDEIRSPESLTSNPSDPATSVKYDDIKLTPNCVTYDELSYLTGRRQSNGYDELMRSPLSTTSSGGYIDPGSSSALGYERILPPPEDQRGHATAEQTEDEDGSTLRYEECGSPSAVIHSCSSPITVTALPAIVCEDQLDSISYLYDDIRTVGRGGGGYGGCYGGSNHSYEPIYAHLGEGTSIKMESSNSTSSLSSTTSVAGPNDKSSDTLSDSSEEGVHEVCSYKLTQLGNGAVPDSPAPSLAGTSTSTRTGAERRSETSDEWIDISDPDEPAWTVTRIRQRHEVTNASFVRRGHRASRRKLSIPKASGQQSWSQTMRTLVKNGFNKATTLSKRSGKDIQRQQEQQANVKSSASSHPSASKAIHSDAGGPSVIQLTKSSARRLPSAETEASGTGSSQTWEDYGESDGDDLADDHHYEALYEVIHPRLQSSSGAAATHLDHNDDSFDDSFDSDDAFEEVVVRGLDAVSDTSRERPGSRSGSERSKESEDPSLRSSQVKIGRFADLAGEQMRRLRRNWTTTKTDIGKSITRIKKKSTASVADLSEVFKPSASRREVSPEKSGSQKELPSPSPPPQEIRPSHVEPKKKGTWAMRQIRRRMTVVSSPNYGAGNKEKASTFYLTLTIEKPAEVNANGKSPAVSETSSPEPVSTPSPVPPLISPADSSKVPVRPKRISSAYALGSQYQSTVRPKTAPPAPPVKSPSSSQQQQAAAESALAASPPPLASIPAKKPLSRLPTAFSESRIAAERSVLMDEYQQSMHYSDIAFVTAGQKHSGPPPSLSTPYSRLSMASVTSSRHSSETYMGVGDLASAPERSTVPDDVRNYLDLQSPIESEELYISSHFADEPLYQFYTAAIIERATQNQGDGSEEDDYEVIGEHRRKEEEEEFQSDNNKGTNAKLPTAMELVMPSSGRRTLWCELPQVINSGLLETISPQQRKLQEAKFELITSEASYLRSLNVLTTHFIQSREFAGDANSEALLSRLERHTLFSDIVPVRECSEALLADLEQRWQENVFIREICDILLEHASKHFEVYIKYCTNQLYQERMLRDLKETKPQFVDCLRRLESSPVCQSLAMHSFLMLPMQRITRLPLLVDAIFHRLESGTPEFERCRMTLATLNKIVQECNEGARKAERIHEMLVVSNQLDFADVKAISVMSASRWLVKKGEMQRLMWRDIDARLTFGRKIHKQTVYVFLFTDLLVITKKKGEDSYAVLDYCPRNMVQVDEHIRTEKPIGKPGSELGKNLILLTMLQNHENKTLEMILSCSSESDRTRWLEAVTPRTSDNPEEKIYEEWDCPQVQAIHPYVATQPDELSLEVADVVNVLRKMADGWYQGERMRDDQRGWFPGNYTLEIASSHVRARNLRQRYRLLALSGNFIEEQARRDKEESKRKSKKNSVVSLNE